MSEYSEESMNKPEEDNDTSGNNVLKTAGRRILNQEDIIMWIHSKAYHDFTQFIKQLNEFAKGVHNSSLQSRNEVTDVNLQKVIAILDQLSIICDQIEPLNDDKDQRYVKEYFIITIN